MASRCAGESSLVYICIVSSGMWIYIKIKTYTSSIYTQIYYRKKERISENVIHAYVVVLRVNMCGGGGVYRYGNFSGVAGAW